MSKNESNEAEESASANLENQTTISTTRLSIAEAQKFLHESADADTNGADLENEADFTDFEYSNDREHDAADAADDEASESVGLAPSPDAERLQKLIARAGIASRRGAEEIVAQGRVMVNGKVVTESGSKADPARDRISVDGQPLRVPTTTTVVLMNKPLGVVSTKKDPEGRTTVTHLLPEKLKHLHPIGRLDYDTSGLLFLTDDGSLTQLLTHPSHGVEKVYWARVRGTVTVQTLKTLEAGIYLQDGKTAPCKARVRAQTENNALVQITLREGRNRQVRRMLDAVGHPVRALRRVRVASFGLDELLPGEYRVLLPGEVHALRKAAETKSKPKAAKPARKPSSKTTYVENRSEEKTEFKAQKPSATSRIAERSPARESVRPTERFASSNRNAVPRTASNERHASSERFSASALTQRLERQRFARQQEERQSSQPSPQRSSSQRPISSREGRAGSAGRSSERQERQERSHPLARRVARSFDQTSSRSAEGFAPAAKAGKQAKPTRPPKAARVFAASTAEAAKAARNAAEKPKPKPFAKSVTPAKTPDSKLNGAKANTLKPSANKASAPKTNANARANNAYPAKPAARRGDRPWGQKTRKRA